MARFLILIGFISVASILTVEVSSSNALVDKVQCVVDVMDKLSNEKQFEPLWKDVQEKLLKNTNNVFKCLQYTGFIMQT